LYSCKIALELKVDQQKFGRKPMPGMNATVCDQFCGCSRRGCRPVDVTEKGITSTIVDSHPSGRVGEVKSQAGGKSSTVLYLGIWPMESQSDAMMI